MTKKRSSEILAEESRKIFVGKDEIGKTFTESEKSEIGGHLIQEEYIIAKLEANYIDVHLLQYKAEFPNVSLRNLTYKEDLQSINLTLSFRPPREPQPTLLR